MCGILAVFGKPIAIERQIKKLETRGPDQTTLESRKGFQLGFTRLAINGIETGTQPFVSDDGTVWMCNGEIYNHKQLESIVWKTQRQSASDCEVLGDLYKCYTQPFSMIDGVFALVIVDGNIATVARDPYGVRPLFMSVSPLRVVFASEIKAFPNDPTAVVSVFPPGHSLKLDISLLEYSLERYHEIVSTPTVSDPMRAEIGILDYLCLAVEKRTMADRPIAALLSGGLDSSLIAALLQRSMKTQLKTFSIGFTGSEDLRCARLVADHIGSDHTEIIMTPDEFFDAIPKVIHDIESFDITTVRASVGNWLIGQHIAKTDYKVVFNGDGADELFGGYMYFHKSPSDEEFVEERDRLLDQIHYFDVLRSDRCISSHGLEPRTPYLDKDFVAYVRRIKASLLRPSSGQQEKFILRNAFDGINILPSQIIWRKKEAFSDGVSSVGGLSWYRECQLRAEKLCPYWKEESSKISYLQPKTAESYYYRSIFDHYYKNLHQVNVPYFWMPKWSPETTDPSARTLNPSTVNST
jgi:asparagine synthase (glutamine-hydrolysing)